MSRLSQERRNGSNGKNGGQKRKYLIIDDILMCQLYFKKTTVLSEVEKNEERYILS